MPPINIRKAAALVGTLGLLKTEGSMLVPVRIIDVSLGYGNLRFIVSPLAGSGQIRVEDWRVIAMPAENPLIELRDAAFASLPHMRNEYAERVRLALEPFANMLEPGKVTP